MSRNPLNLSSSQQAGVNIITVPFVTLFSAISFFRKGVAKVSGRPAAKPAPEAPVAARSSVPVVTPRATFAVADRVCGVDIKGQRVNFFQYYRDSVIRISSRTNRRLEEAAFTPAIADQYGLAYDLDGAIQWIRERGFPSARDLASNSASRTLQNRTARDVDEDDPPFDPPYKSPAKPRARNPSSRGSAAPASSADLVHTLVPIEGTKGRPFTGRIVRFGEEERTGNQGEKPYVTYVMKLESESGQAVKDFVGEHLSELVQQHRLHVGQLVTVQLVGREHFEVIVAGKKEQRRRNHFSVKTH